MFYFMLRNISPIQYTVAIVGFPQSGKTTLLTSLFGEIFARKIIGIEVEVKGQSTIERVNEDLAKLKKGIALGPTKDQDIFAYRTNITIGNIFKRSYKVEFGDFPGDDSIEYIKKYGPWLHKTEFFKWIAEADAIIFIVDIGKYLLSIQKGNSYSAEMVSAIRAAWQHILDTKSASESTSRIRRRPILIAFNKADLLSIDKKESKINDINKLIMTLGFSNKTPGIIDIDELYLNELRKDILNDFSDLFQYFKGEVSHFKYIFTSSFALVNNKRVGIQDLLIYVLPKDFYP